MTSDPLSSLQLILDPVHGGVPGQIAGFGRSTMFAGLLGSPMLDRLRRIKQLGFASYAYLTADHTRYAHAVGTMHVMHSIASIVLRSNGFLDRITSEFKDCGLFTLADATDLQERLLEHLLAAALLQDVGELPYNIVTPKVYRPGPHIRERVADLTGIDPRALLQWDDKNLFTVASFAEPANRDLLAKLDLGFLIFLITGCCRLDLSKFSALQTLRQMLDGSVDADRLDYVFRDAYHTIGAIGTAQSVLESLVGYDHSGPIFSDAMPVCNFLLTRASLWTSVYYVPQTRFRITLLSLVFAACRNDAKAQKLAFPNGTDGRLRFDEFYRLDDGFVQDCVQKLARPRDSDRPNFKPRVERALDILAGKDYGYHCLWVPESLDNSTAVQFDLPNDFFYDLYEDYHRHSLYRQRSIRIDGERFAEIRRPLYLEGAAGPFRPLFHSTWSAHPMPESVLVFRPGKQEGARWTSIDEAIRNKSLYSALTQHSIEAELSFPWETWTNKDFASPRIFISYTGLDRRVTKLVVEALHRKGRQYMLFIGRSVGLGQSTIKNSVDAAKAAEAAILLVSRTYLERYKNHPHHALTEEFDVLADRCTRVGVPVVPMALDPHEELADFRHERFGEQHPFFLGRALVTETEEEIFDAISDALNFIERRLKSRNTVS